MKKQLTIILISSSFLFSSCEKIQTNFRAERIVKRGQSKCGWAFSKDEVISIEKIKGEIAYITKRKRCPFCDSYIALISSEKFLEVYDVPTILLNCEYQKMEWPDSTKVRIRGYLIERDISGYGADAADPIVFYPEEIERL